MHFIHNKEEYLAHITRYCTTTEEKKNVIKEAYKVALDTRKFEIDLYWKRATYFWGFLVAIFAAYFLVYTRGGSKAILLVLLSLLGILTSVGWYFVNRGSKVWQENWEKHIAFLEDDINGPLFKTIIVPNLKFSNLAEGYPNSVSKVNMLLSLSIVCFWFSVFIFSIFRINFNQYFDVIFQASYDWLGYAFISLMSLSTIFLTVIIFNKYTRSFKYYALKNYRSHIEKKNPSLFFNGTNLEKKKKNIVEQILLFFKK